MKNEKNAGGPAAYVMKRKTGIQFLILAVLIGVIAAATVGSAVGLHAAMDRSTQSYVKDVAAQLAAIPLYLRSAKLHRDGAKGENA